MTTPAKAPRTPRPKDLAAIAAWVGGATLTQAWQENVARNPEASHAIQAASNWARQPHIREAVKAARAELIQTHYGDVNALVTAQLAKFEAVFTEGMKLRPDANGVIRPESLAAALGAVMGITKLFATAQGITATRFDMIRVWREIAADLHVSRDIQEQIERGILTGPGY